MNTKVKAVLESHRVGAGFANSDGGVVCGPVPGASAFQIWDALRRVFPETGTWPIIRGDNEEQPERADGFDPEEEIRGAPKGSIRDVLRTAFQDRIAAYSDFADKVSGAQIPEAIRKALGDRLDAFSGFAKGLEDDETFESFARGADASGANEFAGVAPKQLPWPESKVSKPIVFHSTVSLRTQRPHSSVQLALVPVRDPSEAAAVLGFGGWNDCPEPAVIVAALREWARGYGAMPACMTHDVLECYVERPPQTEDEAFALASEQWLFCEDIVSQGTQSVRALAIELWKSPQWFFWWD